MIYYGSGPVTVREPGLSVIDCGGVGYGCRITAYTSGQLKLKPLITHRFPVSQLEDAINMQTSAESIKVLVVTEGN